VISRTGGSSSSAGDARLGLVDDAVSFWNKTLQEIGVCYSLRPVTRLVQSVPEEALQSVSFWKVVADRPKFRRFSVWGHRDLSLRNRNSYRPVFLATEH
jgi:hypothetical protein